MAAWDEGRPCLELLKSDPDVTEHLDPDEIEGCFDPARYLRDADVDLRQIGGVVSVRGQARRLRKGPRALRDRRRQLLLVASDRISAYDVVLPKTIPDKGKVLTGLSHYWFEIMDEIPNHSDLGPSRGPSRRRYRRPRRVARCSARGPSRSRSSSSCAATSPARGGRSTRRPVTVCGHRLPEGLVESAQLPEPILTPATKAVDGSRREHHRGASGRDRRCRHLRRRRGRTR